MTTEEQYDAAVRALFVAASELPVDCCRELNRLITERITVLLAREDTPASKVRRKEMRLIGALRACAEELGHPPSTSEFLEVYGRRRQAGEDWPSVATVLRHFRGWPSALTAAGLTGEDPLPSHYYRSRRAGCRKYPEQRLVDCLQACARQYQRSPPPDYFDEWREERLAGRPGRRPIAADIPTVKTYYNRYGSWPNALRAAGLSPSPVIRTTPLRYSTL